MRCGTPVVSEGLCVVCRYEGASVQCLGEWHLPPCRPMDVAVAELEIEWTSRSDVWALATSHVTTMFRAAFSRCYTTNSPPLVRSWKGSGRTRNAAVNRHPHRHHRHVSPTATTASATPARMDFLDENDFNSMIDAMKVCPRGLCVASRTFPLKTTCTILGLDSVGQEGGPF